MNKKREKMPLSERAKQFAPFSPLSGLNKALREREKIYTPKEELFPESAEELSAALFSLEKGMRVKLVYYSEGAYISCEGIITAVDKTMRYLTIVKTTVSFDDIYEVCRFTQ